MRIQRFQILRITLGHKMYFDIFNNTDNIWWKKLQSITKSINISCREPKETLRQINAFHCFMTFLD